MKKPVSDEGPDPIDQYVGARIRGRRMGLKISQTKLGRAIGVTFQQIQKYESGSNRVGASNLYKISRALSVDVAFFFEGIIDPPLQACSGALSGMAEPAADVLDISAMTSRESVELLQNYFRVADPLVRKRLLQLIRAVAFNESDA